MEGLYIVISALIGAIATIASVFLRQRFSKSKNRDPILTEHQNSDNIYTALNFVMEQMGADRAYIFQFHNGSYYMSGRSQQKFSCTHETTTQGVSRESSYSQNHIVSNYHEYIDSIVKDECFSFQTAEVVGDHAFAALMKGKGVQSIYNIPIKTLNNKIIGILGVDYVKKCVEDSDFSVCDVDHAEKFCEQTNEFMRRQARIIAGYLV